MSTDSGATASSFTRMCYRPPYDWPAVLAWLRARAIPGVEKVAGGSYLRRYLRPDGSPGTVTVSHRADLACLAVHVHMPHESAPQLLVDRLRAMFDTAADIATIHTALAGDPLLGKLVLQRPGLRVPGAWDAFELAVRAILGQQITLEAGRRLTETLVRLCGAAAPDASHADTDLDRIFPTAAQVSRVKLDALGMPDARKRTLRALARAALDDPRLFEPGPDLERSVARLRAIAGIGEWTAHYIAMRALREADAFPATDAALLRCMAKLEGTRPDRQAFVERAQRWRPWRAYAAQHLWSAGTATAELSPIH